MKILIVGAGRVGSRLAQEMSDAGHEITLIDWRQEALARAAARGVLGDNFRGNVLVGDGTDEDLLRRAGIEDADAFVAVTEGDNRNIMASQIAQYVFNVPRVVCRIYDPMRDEVYTQLGLSTLCPTKLGASSIRQMLQEA